MIIRGVLNLMSQMTRFSDSNEGKLSWEDIQYQIMFDYHKAKTKGDVNGLHSCVENLDIFLEPFKDERYNIDMGDLKDNISKYNRNKQFSSDDEENMYYFEQQMRILSRLLGRVNSGELIARETIDDSDIVKEIASKILKGQGQNSFFTGSPGSGKSWSCLRFCEEISKRLDVPFTEKHICFTIHEFFKKYNDENLCPPGSSLIFEEVGVNVNARKSMSNLNKIFGDIFQTARHRKMNIVLNAPDLSFLDSTPRKLLHWWFKTDRIDRNKNRVVLSPHVIEVDQRSGNILYPYPRFDGTYKVKTLYVLKPSQYIIDKYEKIAKDYKDKLALDNQNIVEESDPESITKVEQLYINYREQGMQGIDAAQKLKKNYTWLSKTNKKLKMLGYNFDLRKNNKAPKGKNAKNY